MRIKIYRSPFHPPIEVAGEIVVKLHVPYTATSTAVEINPNIQEYQEQSDASPDRVRQIMVTTPTDETRRFIFDLNGTKKHRAHIGSSVFDIELLNVKEEMVQGANARCFEFEVNKV